MSGPRHGVSDVPELETERLLLRGWREADLDEYALAAADPEVARFIGGVKDRTEAWRQIALFAGHWSLRGYGLWALERRSDGALIGRAGLWRPEGWPGLEVGWTLVRDAWGQGYASEAARASVEWGFDVLGARRLISLIDPANERSQRVARRLGMEPLREEILFGGPCIIFGMTADAYRRN